MNDEKQEELVVKDDPRYRKVSEGFIVAADRNALNTYRERIRKSTQKNNEISRLNKKVTDLQHRVEILEQMLLSLKEE
jgi:uncharacterized protein YlxW (UPF0749 family)